ncbi:T9SS type A sorting domain-containing protein [Flavobacterium sp.]|uniref:T9SS type A sorting domain-containing protein n=1 Tax=Flavobacterium sp. TaxID=239 RepID=UPI00261FA68A|nr:T9SS type A sorting domain-containing protein [Flavobacterium sp.]
MRTKLIHLFFITQFSTFFGQIIIENNQVMPIGMNHDINFSSLFIQNETLFTDDIPSGPNAIWNYSNLPFEFSRNMKVVSPNNAPFGPNFSANRVVLMNNGEIDSQYLQFSNNDIRDMGRFNGTGIKSTKFPGEVLLKFPATYEQFEQSTFEDKIKFYVGMPLATSYVVDSVRTVSTIELTYLIDGWGTVTTPSGSFQALRQQVYKATTSVSDFLRADTNEWVLGAEIDTFADRYFVFWTNTQCFPVLQLRDIGDTGVINDVYWLANPTLSNTDFESHNFTVVPNPFTEKFNINIGSFQEAEVDIFETYGRKVKSIILRGGETQINMSELSAGMYLVKIKINSKEQTIKVIKK